MGAKMKSEKNSWVLLSSKRTKADTRTRADEAFALPSFVDATSILQKRTPQQICRDGGIWHSCQKDVEILKQTMLKHESMFREQVRELHRLYQVQRLMMAETERKDPTIFVCSAPPSLPKSSLLSPFSSDSIKPGKERNLQEPANELSSGSRHDSKDDAKRFCEVSNEHSNASSRGVKCLALNPEQGSPLSELTIGNKLSQDDVINCESSFKLPIKAVQRTFDLERPAEDYMDDEVLEKKLQENPAMGMVVKQGPSDIQAVLANGCLEQENEVHLWPGTVCNNIKNAYVRESDVSPTSSFGENITEEHLFLKQLRCSEEIAFFPTVSMKNEVASEDSSFCLAPVLSTKSLSGVLLGKNQEGQMHSLSMPELQNNSVEQKGRKTKRQSLDREARERSTEENPKQLHWQLQGSITAKPMVSNPFNLKSSWHQHLPVFLHKQNVVDTSMSHGEKCRPILSQEHLTSSGNSFPSLQGGPADRPLLGSVPTVATGQGTLKVSHHIEEIANGSMPFASSLRDDGGAEQLSCGMYMHEHSLVSNIPSDLLTHFSESQVSLHKHNPFGSDISRAATVGSLHDITGQHLFPQQNSSASLMQKQHLSVPQLAGLALSVQGTRGIPVHVGIEDVQPSINLYEPRLLGATSDNLSWTADNKVCKVTANNSLPLGSMASNVVVPLKWQYDMGIQSTTSNVELTLAPSGKLTEQKNNQDIDSIDTQSKEQHTGCLPQKLSQDLKLISGTLSSQIPEEKQNQKYQSANSNLSFPQFSFTAGIATEEYPNNLSQEVKLACRTTGVGRQVFFATATLSEQDLNVEGFEFKEPVDELMKSKQTYSASVTEKHGVVDCGEPGDWSIPEGKKLGGNATGVSGQTQDISIPEQQLSEVIRDSCALLAIEKCTQYSEAKENNNKTDINLASETCVSMDTSSTGIEVGACVEGLCKTVAAAYSEKRGGEDCWRQELDLVPVQKFSSTNWNAHIVQGGLNLASLSGEEDSSGLPKFHVTSKEPEISKLASSNSFLLDGLKLAENGEIVSLKQHGNDVQVHGAIESPDSIDDTSQAAEILLLLASSFPSGQQGTKDCTMCTPDRPPKWFADVIPRKDDYFGSSILAQSAVGLIESPESSSIKGRVHHKLCMCMEASSYTEPDVRDPENLDFFESVTLMLKASGISADEARQQMVEQLEDVRERSYPMQRGRSSRRGRAIRDFQREMLPSIASLSRQEITEDLQTIGGLMRSATEIITRRNSGLSYKDSASNSPTGQHVTRNFACPRGSIGSVMTKCSMHMEEKQNSDVFPQISSWGYATRRRRMRRHRSQWSLVSAKMRVSSPWT